MTNTIDLHANMFLHTMFRERGWANPSQVPVETQEITGLALLESLQIPKEQVGAIFVNGKAYQASEAIIHPGDRVALFSPSAPMFVFLSFRDHSYTVGS
jgi:sulfur carrier protein ThiS